MTAREGLCSGCERETYCKQNKVACREMVIFGEQGDKPDEFHYAKLFGFNVDFHNRKLAELAKKAGVVEMYEYVMDNVPDQDIHKISFPDRHKTELLHALARWFPTEKLKEIWKVSQ